MGGLALNREYTEESDRSTCKNYPNDTCVNKSIYYGFDQISKNAIVDRHNILRNKVAKGNQKEGKKGEQPQAANMKKMSWNDELAEIAQRWTDQCIFGHDNNRNLCDGTYVGQNAYISWSSRKFEDYSPLTDSERAVQSWYDEVLDPGFDSAQISPFKFDYNAGHYTQVVWAETDRVGCGLRHYSEVEDKITWYKTLIVCNYAKGGNWNEGTMYQVGKPASQCPDGTKKDSKYRCLCA